MYPVNYEQNALKTLATFFNQKVTTYHYADYVFFHAIEAYYGVLLPYFLHWIFLCCFTIEQ
jgi:hypothetical protein